MIYPWKYFNFEKKKEVLKYSIEKIPYPRFLCRIILLNYINNNISACYIQDANCHAYVQIILKKFYTKHKHFNFFTLKHSFQSNFSNHTIVIIKNFHISSSHYLSPFTKNDIYIYIEIHSNISKISRRRRKRKRSAYISFSS